MSKIKVFFLGAPVGGFRAYPKTDLFTQYDNAYSHKSSFYEVKVLGNSVLYVYGVNQFVTKHGGRPGSNFCIALQIKGVLHTDIQYIYKRLRTIYNNIKDSGDIFEERNGQLGFVIVDIDKGKQVFDKWINLLVKDLELEEERKFESFAQIKKIGENKALNFEESNSIILDSFRQTGNVTLFSSVPLQKNKEEDEKIVLKIGANWHKYLQSLGNRIESIEKETIRFFNTTVQRNPSWEDVNFLTSFFDKLNERIKGLKSGIHQYNSDDKNIVRNISNLRNELNSFHHQLQKFREWLIKEKVSIEEVYLQKLSKIETVLQEMERKLEPISISNSTAFNWRLFLPILSFCFLIVMVIYKGGLGTKVDEIQNPTEEQKKLAINTTNDVHSTPTYSIERVEPSRTNEVSTSEENSASSNEQKVQESEDLKEERVDEPTEKKKDQAGYFRGTSYYLNIEAFLADAVSKEIKVATIDSFGSCLVQFLRAQSDYLKEKCPDIGDAELQKFLFENNKKSKGTIARKIQRTIKDSLVDEGVLIQNNKYWKIAIGGRDENKIPLFLILKSDQNCQ